MKDSAQKITVSDTYAYEAVNEMTGGYGMAAFGALVILSGMFFLIHNVMQISMTGDVRQMGLLNVIGTTEKQIRRIYYGQLFRVLTPGSDRRSSSCPQGLCCSFSRGSWGIST